jgi:tetratricopeptide (TPR) repeat protein
VGDGKYIESGRSYYARTQAFGVTPGHTNGADLPYPALAAGASVARCLRCHSTGSLGLDAGLAIRPSENGIGCEACHGPGAQHIALGGAPEVIGNPGRMNAVEVNQFCGTCHRRPPEPDEPEANRIAVAVKFDWSNHWNVRHQPAYLSQSACFRGSGGRLSCITCHDPHTAASVPLSEYDSRCARCHRQVKHTMAVSGPCAGCHMPAVMAAPEMQFADHWIGIYARGGGTAPLPSKRALPPLVLPSTAEGKRVPPNDPSTLRPLFEQAQAMRRERFGPASTEAAQAASLLGSFLKGLAMPGVEQALREALQIDRGNHSERATEDAMELGELLLTSGSLPEAVALFEEAARSTDLHVAARSYAALAKLETRNESVYYRKAVAAEEAVSGKDSPRVAALLSNLGLALRARGELAEAEAVLRRSLRIQDDAFGLGNLSGAVSMNNLGTVLQSRGKLAEAESLERQAVAIFERKMPHTSELAAAYANLASVIAEMDNRGDAEDLLRRAIATDEEAGGKETLQEAADLTNLGRLLKGHDTTAAAASLQQALSIFEHRAGANSREAQEVRAALAGLRSGPK